jgi:hypothetical protein
MDSRAMKREASWSALLCAGIITASLTWGVGANAEIVNVKYRGMVDLSPFACENVTGSSFIERVCYDVKNTYMLIELNGTWYHYCEIDQDTTSNLLAAESMGRYYNASIKGRFDCRTHRVPGY